MQMHILQVEFLCVSISKNQAKEKVYQHQQQWQAQNAASAIYVCGIA